MATPVEVRGSVHRKGTELDDWTQQYTEAALEPDLPIIDPHHHVWDDDRRGRYLIHELVADISTGHNILATVAVEAGVMLRADGSAAMKPVGETEFFNGIAAMSASGAYGKSRLCAGIVGHADLTLGKEVQPVLEALIAAGNGRLRGIRHGVTWDPGSARAGRHQVRHQLLDRTFREGLACLRHLGLSFEAWQFYHQLPELGDLVRAFPSTSIIVNHTGGLIAPDDGKPEDVFPIWRERVREIAQFPNLTMKIGGLGMTHCGWSFHRRSVPPSSEELAAAWRPYVENSIEAFGVHRCMMESNFPVDKQSCGYGVLWNALKRITKNYSPAEKAALYHDTAASVYRLAA